MLDDLESECLHSKGAEPIVKAHTKGFRTKCGTMDNVVHLHDAERIMIMQDELHYV